MLDCCDSLLRGVSFLGTLATCYNNHLYYTATNVCTFPDNDPI